MTARMRWALRSGIASVEIALSSVNYNGMACRINHWPGWLPLNVVVGQIARTRTGWA
jgi:hypothetical protein